MPVAAAADLQLWWQVPGPPTDLQKRTPALRVGRRHGRRPAAVETLDDEAVRSVVEWPTGRGRGGHHPFPESTPVQLEHPVMAVGVVAGHAEQRVGHPGAATAAYRGVV